MESLTSSQGASTGAGLGNAFLSHVRSVDGIFQVVRAFDDSEVIHVEGEVDPLRDMAIIQNELRLKDIEWVEKHLEGLRKNTKTTNNKSLEAKAQREELAVVEKVYHLLTEEKRDVRKGDWNNKEVSRCLIAFVSDTQLYCRQVSTLFSSFMTTKSIYST